MLQPKATKRVQVYLPAESYDILVQLSAEKGQSIPALVREAIETDLVQPVRRAKKVEALQQLCRLELPVDDWEIMEQELMDGRYEELYR